MICLNCKKQMPDDAPNCPNCGAPVMPDVQIGQEVRFRRWQRWFFYGVFVVLFLGSVAFALKVYMDNEELLKTLVDLNNTLVRTESELTDKSVQIQQVQGQLTEIQGTLSAKETEINEKMTELQRLSAQRDSLMTEYDSFKTSISATNAKIFNLIIELGKGASFEELSRIPVADFNLGSGVDTDGDGLSDIAEAAFGTDPNNPDTDGDGYTDKQEILGGFNPLGTGRYPIDLNYANSQKGRILIQVEGNNEAWYVNPVDGKRYFLGRPMEVSQTIEGETRIEQ